MVSSYFLQYFQSVVLVAMEEPEFKKQEYKLKINNLVKILSTLFFNITWLSVLVISVGDVGLCETVSSLLALFFFSEK